MRRVWYRLRAGLKSSVVFAQAGIQHSKIERPQMLFRRLMRLKQLHHRRKFLKSQTARQILNVRIRKAYRCELRFSRSRQSGHYRGNASMWQTRRTQLPKPSGQQCAQQPTSDEFELASMLEGLFVGPLSCTMHPLFFNNYRPLKKHV